MSNDAVFEANWLEEQLNEIFGATEVTNLNRLSGGANRETWSLKQTLKKSSAH